MIKKNNILVNKFLIISIFCVFLKVLLSGLFSSDYQVKIFIPFVDYFVTSLQNPWDYFYQENKEVAFPYPPLMLYLLSPFKFIINFFNINNIFLENLFFKIPSLLLDILIFICLLKLFPQKKNSVLLIYFLSPIILYSVYINSQLDLIPIAFLFFSYYLLINKRFHLSAISISIAMLCKSNVFVALPLIIIYLLKNTKFQNLLIYCAIIFLSYFIISYPFITTSGYQFFVLNNPEQSLIFSTFQIIANKKFLWVVAILIILYGRFYYYNKINENLLIDFINLSFIILLTLTYPIPAWYVWIVPFVSIYFLDSDDIFHYKALILFYLFTVLYLAYSIFVFLHPFQENGYFVDIIFLNNPIDLKYHFSSKANNLIFTSLNTSILIFALLIFQKSIKRNITYRYKNLITIGIAGDSGSGKSLFSSDFKNLIGEKDYILLEGDGEHKWEREDKNWKEFTHLNPMANKLHNQFEMLRTLTRGKSILKSNYDHSTGKFTPPFIVKPKKLIVLDSLHPFYLPKARKLIDIKVYMNPDESLRKKWKFDRDENVRKHKSEAIEKEIQRREPDKQKYILPQLQYADIVFGYQVKTSNNLNEKIAENDLKLKISLEADVVLDDILEDFEKIASLKFEHDYSVDLKKQEIVLDGKISINDLENLAEKNITNISEIISNEIVWHNNYRGIRQLFILLMINNLYKD